MRWEKVKIDEVCTVYGGTTPLTSTSEYWDGDILWMSPTDLPAVGEITLITESARKITGKAVKESSLAILPKGSVIYSTRASIGKIGIAGTNLTTNQGFTNMVCGEQVFSQYLAYTLKYFTPQIAKLGNSTTFQEVSRTAIKNFLIPLPPLPTQRAIAARLDRANALRQKDRHLLQAYDELAQAVFVEMFGDPVRNEKGWEVKKLGEISQKTQIGPFGTQLHAEDYIENGIPLVNPMHIVKSKIKADFKFSVSQGKYAELTNYHLKKGDIVMGRRGEMGRCAMVTEHEDGWLCGTGSLYIRPQEFINSIFLLNYLTHKSVKKMLENEAQGVTMSNLNLTIVNNLKIVLPPLPLQTRFAAILANIEQQKELVRQQQAESEALFGRLLQEAFEN